MEKITDELIKAYALKNAIEHGGKAVVGSILSPLFHEGLEKDEVREIMPRINEILKEVNSLGVDKQRVEFKRFEDEISHRTEREGLPDLPDAKEGKVVTRFAPSPSGPMHIGHAATGMPSALYAKKYKGKFIVRIEDTNPENIYEPAYSLIPKEGDWIFGNVTQYVVQSDRMNRYYEYAEELIRRGKAYICECDTEEFRELISKKKACKCRNLSSEENIRRWKKMFDLEAGYRQGEVVLRFKSNIEDPNPALRDFPLARINDSKHPRQGKKYRVWPLMNLSVFVDDLEFGTTHAIRAKEHQDNAKRQEMMFDVFEKKAPISFFLGRFKFEDLEISCSKTKERIDSEEFSGWGDIKLPFLTPLRKRGFQREAFEAMTEQRGLSDVDKVLTGEEYFELLANFNREVIRDKVKEIKYSLEEEDGWREEVILMPTGETRKLFVDCEEFSDGDLAFFKRIGYARFNFEEKRFWFAHS